jgi:FkbM family methyltransferase
MSLGRSVARRVRRLVRGSALELPPSVTAIEGSAASIVPREYPGHDLRLLATSERERKWRTRPGKKEPWTVRWLEASTRGGGVLYDVGANVGAFSLIAAKLCGSRGTVVAFEPGFASYAHLCSNIVLNGCQSVIIPVPLALGSANTVSGFSYRSVDPGQSRHEFRQGAWSAAEAADSGRYLQPVLSMTLDSAMSTFNLPAPNYIKVDVDGHELAVLEGAARTLAAGSVRSVLIEIDGTLTEAAIALLRRSGFVLDGWHERGHAEETETRVWYGVFRRENVSAT